MPSIVNIHEAKTHLSRLLVQVAQGGEVLIAKNGVPLAKLVGLTEKQPRQPGRFEGWQTHGEEALLKPLSAEEINRWTESGSDDPLVR